MTKQQIKRFDRAKSPTFHDRELRSISKCVQTTNAERLISLRKRTFCLSKKKRMILFRVLHTEENFKIVGRKSTNISCNMQHANKYPLERIVQKQHRLSFCIERTAAMMQSAILVITKAAVCHGISKWLPNWTKSHLTLQTPLTVSDHLNQFQEDHQEVSFFQSYTR